MKTKTVLVALMLLAFCLAGCASAGTKIDPAAVASIQKGKTTKAELIAALGAPMSASLMADGREMLFWSYAHTQIKGATLIPIVGLMAGGSDTKMDTLQVILGQDKLVENFSSNQSNIEARMGR